MAARLPDVIDVHKGFAVLVAAPIGVLGLALTEANLVAGVLLFLGSIAVAVVFGHRYHPDSRRRW